MKNLKKALGKEELKKYQNNRTQTHTHNNPSTSNHNQKPSSTFLKKPYPRDIDELIECRATLTKNIELSLQSRFLRIIEEGFQGGELRNLDQMIRRLEDKWVQIQSKGENHRLDEKVKVEGVKRILQRMVEQEESLNIKSNQFNMTEFIKIVLEEVEKILRELRHKDKESSLKEFDQIIKILRPTPSHKPKFEEPKPQLQQIPQRPTLKNSLSNANLKIKVTFQQYQVKEELLNQLRKKKSQGNLNAFISKNSSGPNSHNGKQTTQDYKAKLENLLKEPSIKIIKKKKVQYDYDYSAIFQASKGHIKQRNRTFHPNGDKERQIEKERELKNKVVNNGKKNDAFIFYRPTAATKK